MSDILDMLSGNHREVGPDPDTGMRYLLLRRRYDADIADVWHAVVDPDRLRRWFLPVEGDLREGGTFQLKDNAGGAIRTCHAPTYLAVTWSYGGAPETFVDLRLSEDGDATVLELRHSPVPPAIELAGRMVDPIINDEATGMWGMGAGWEMGFVALASYLSGSFPADGSPEDNPEVIEAANRISAAWAVIARPS